MITAHYSASYFVLDALEQYNYYAPMIYTALCILFWMHAYPLLGQVGGSWALEFESFLGPVKWHRADRRVPFGAQKTREFQDPTPSYLPK
jgi:hypothetical protein